MAPHSKLDGKQILDALERLLKYLPTNRIEISTITDGLNCPEHEAQTISGIALGTEDDGVVYYLATYYDANADAECALGLTREGAIFLLGIAANYRYFEEAQKAAATEENKANGK